MLLQAALLVSCLGLLQVERCHAMGNAVPPEELEKIEDHFRRMNPNLKYDTLFYMDQIAGRYSLCNYTSQYLEVYDTIYRGVKDNVGILIDSLAGKSYAEAVVEMAQKWSFRAPTPGRIQTSKSFGCSLTVNCPPDNRTAFSCAFSAIIPTTPAPRERPTDPPRLTGPTWKPLAILSSPANNALFPPLPPADSSLIHALTPQLYKDIKAEVARINPAIAYDDVYFMDHASARHNFCPFQTEYAYSTGRVELTLADHYGVISSVGRGVPYKYSLIYNAVMDMVKDWTARDAQKLSYPKKFGCSIIPECHGDIVLACAFYPIRLSDWNGKPSSMMLQDSRIPAPVSKVDDLSSMQMMSAKSLFGMRWQDDILFNGACHELAKCDEHGKEIKMFSGNNFEIIRAKTEKRHLTEDSAIIESLRKIKSMQPYSSSQEFRCCHIPTCERGESLTVTCVFRTY